MKFTNSRISAIWRRKLEKTTELSQKKSIFGQTYMKFDGYHGNVKDDWHTIDLSKFPQRMKEQLLKVSAP